MLILHLSHKDQVLEMLVGEGLMYVFISPVANDQLKDTPAIRQELFFRHQQRGPVDNKETLDRVNTGVEILSAIQPGDTVIYNLRDRHDQAYKQLKTLITGMLLKGDVSSRNPPTAAPDKRAGSPLVVGAAVNTGLSSFSLVRSPMGLRREEEWFVKIIGIGIGRR